MNPESLLPPLRITRRDLIIAFGLFVLLTLIFSGLALPPDWIYRGAVDMPYYLAQETTIRSSLHGEGLPLWNIYFNEPLLANPQAAVLYPLALVLRWLPAETALYWLVTLHLWLASLGMYWLLRAWHVIRPAAVGGALVIALSTTVIWRPVIGHITMLYAIPWAVWLYFFYQRLLAERRLSDFMLSASCVVMLILAGHVQFSAIALALPAGHFVFYSAECAAKRDRRRILSAIGVSFGLALISGGLLAVQLLPLLEYLPLTSRSVNFTLEEASIGGLDLCNMASSYLPMTAMIWPASGVCNRMLHEASLYSILPAWWLVYIAVRFGQGRKRSLALWLMLWLLLSLVLAIGVDSPVYRGLYQVIPFMRVPGRFTVWWAVAMPILIGLGLDRLFKTNSREDLRSWQTSMLLLTLLPMILLLLMMLLRTYISTPATLADPVWMSTILPIIVISLLPLMAWIYPLIRLPDFTAPQRRQIMLLGLGFDLMLALALVVQMNLFSIFNPQYHSNQISLVYESLVIDPTQVRLPFRSEIASRYAAVHGIPALQSYSANLQNTENLTQLGYERGNLAQAAGYEVTVDAVELPGTRIVQQTARAQLIEYEGNPPRALVVHDFVLANSDEEALQLMSLPSFDFRRQAIVLEPPSGLTPDEDPGTARAEFLEYDSDSLRLRVESDRAGLLVLFDACYPGWQATVNTEPVEILCVNHASRGVVIPAGLSEIEMRFRPASFRIGAWISAGTFVLLIMMMVLIKRHNRRHPTTIS